jgi:hypothetical protein
VKLLLPLVGAALLLAACSGAPTSPTAKQTPNTAARHDVSCASGYVVAYDENGNPYCAPE